jgi:hypothetical protein
MYINLYRYLPLPATSSRLLLSLFRNLSCIQRNDSIGLTQGHFKHQCLLSKQAVRFTSTTTFHDTPGIQENISALQMKKRPIRRKRTIVASKDLPTSDVRLFLQQIYISIKICKRFYITLSLSKSSLSYKELRRQDNLFTLHNIFTLYHY